MKNNPEAQNTETSNYTEITARVLRELNMIEKDESGRRKLTLHEISNLAVETRLIVLLDAASHTVFIADRDVFNALKSEFYSDFDAKRGGLTWDAYNKYARQCKPVQEAAQRHRDFVAANKR